MSASQLQSFAENWSAMLLMVLYIILIPFGIAGLMLSTFRRYLGPPYHEQYAAAGRVLAIGAWSCFLICLVDIFYLQTVVISLLAAAVSALISFVVAGYLHYQARSRYGQTFILNNG